MKASSAAWTALPKQSESEQPKADPRAPSNQREPAVDLIAGQGAVRPAIDARNGCGVFSIDVTSTCVHCGGAARIVASIEEPDAIRAILGQFGKNGALEEAHYRPSARAPPAAAA